MYARQMNIAYNVDQYIVNVSFTLCSINTILFLLY